MIRSLGILGIVGLLIVAAGIALIAYVEPLIAAGMAAILVGVGIVVMNLVRRMMSKFGFGAMM